MAIVRDFQVNNGLEVNLNANVASTLSASDYFANTSAPANAPSIAIDFRHARELGQLNLTRASTGTYLAANGIIAIANTNAPRFEYTSNGACRGLLIEEPRTNLYPWGDRLNTMMVTGNYQNSVATMTTIANGSPMGTDCWQSVSMTDSSYNSHYLFDWNNTATLQFGLPYTWSIFVKPISTDAGLQSVAMRLWTGAGRAWTTGRWAYFNLITGQPAGTSGTVVASGIIPYPDGWYRLYICAYPDQTGFSGISFDLSSSYKPGITTYQIWGGQLERGVQLTSYIPTDGVSLTRAADLVTANTTNTIRPWFNQNGGTLYGEFIPTTPNWANNGYPFYMSLTGLDVDNQVLGIYAAAASDGRFQMTDFNGLPNGTIISNIETATNTPVLNVMGNTYKIAISYTSNTDYIAVNGIGSPTNPQVNARASFTQLNLSQATRYQYQPSSIFKKFVYYPAALANTQLTFITS